MPTYKIHPAIGFARVGNSPDEFFIGPEKPLALLDPGGFKDYSCRIKRQAARFRVFVYPDDNSPAYEYVPSAGDVVTWEVGVRGNINSGTTFSGSVTGTGATALVYSSTPVDPDDARLGNVLLAELRSESPARLLVLGGFGWLKLRNVGGNDDTCDGYVRVTITTPAGALTVAPAWVVTAPPKFAPQLESIVTLQDICEARAGGPLGVTSYAQHVYPILRRAASMGWLEAAASGHHTWDLTDVASLPRDIIFQKLKIPSGVTPPPGVTGGNMPPITNLTLTSRQYLRMQDFWSDTNFTSDWAGEPGSTPGEPTPAELDRAALEACVGGPFAPGIEVNSSFVDPSNFETDDPGRIRHTGSTMLPPGLLRWGLEAGWLGDYLACVQWPVARPQQVLVGAVYRDWARGALTREDAAANWTRLGFVEKQFDGAYREAERCLDKVIPRPLEGIAVSVLDGIRRFVDIVDPAPPDVGLLRQIAERVDDALAPAPMDQLSDIVGRLDSMNESELHAALLETRATAARANAATKLIESKLERKRRR